MADWNVLTKEPDGSPRIVELDTGSLHIKVHRHIHERHDVWLLSVTGKVSLRNEKLLCRDLPSAQKEALRELKELLHDLEREVYEAQKKQGG